MVSPAARLALAALLAPAALAAQEEAPKGGLLSPHGGLMVWTLAIFVVLVFVLTRYAFGPITASPAPTPAPSIAQAPV